MEVNYFATGATENDSLPFKQPGGSVITKAFSPLILKQPALDIRFDWVVFGYEHRQLGLEFRDLYGRLIFAVKSLSDHQLAYATQGAQSDSSAVKSDWQPQWQLLSVTGDPTYSIHLECQFGPAKRELDFSITTMDGDLVISRHHLPIAGRNLAKLVAINYDPTSKPIAQTVYHYSMIRVADNASLPLAGRKLYAFGDSVINGHYYEQAGFIDFLGRQEGMQIQKYALNGAPIMLTPKCLYKQIDQGPRATPDFILFDGGTNDAYAKNIPYFGQIGTGRTLRDFDLTTYAGALEAAIWKMKFRWPSVKLVFLMVPKYAAHPMDVQKMLHQIQLDAANKWSLSLVNMFDDSRLNSLDDGMRRKYTFDVLDKNGLPGNEETVPTTATSPSGTHPNLLAIEEFYVPETLRVLTQLIENEIN